MPPEWIDEASRRWPDWQGGRPLLLPDGQSWTFYEPIAMLRAGKPGWTFGVDVPSDVDAVLSARFNRILALWEQASDETGRAAAILHAAWFLLARNYAITAEEFQSILGLATDQHQATFELLLAHVGIVCGRSVIHAREAV